MKETVLLNRYLELFNFTTNPFIEVAAEKEELLDKYFVTPKYFAEVLGNARQPKSYVVFGSRGGGKSAIRSMIDFYCKKTEDCSDVGGKVLCITYDDFSALKLHQIDTISLSDHINEILKLGVLQLVLTLADHDKTSDNLNDYYSGLLRWYIDEYMSDLSKLQLDIALRKLKNVSEKLTKLASDITTFYNFMINILKLKEIPPFKPSDLPKHQRDSISSIFVFEVFLQLVTNVGFDAMYILIDKIDETDRTGDCKKAAGLVSTLLTNIKLLELDKCAYKFFLWDNIRSNFGPELRQDRIPVKQIMYSDKELENMLDGRIKAYSDNRTSFTDFFAHDSMKQNAKKWVIEIAYKSPRDLIRLMNSLLNEAAIEASHSNYLISKDLFRDTLERFSRERSNELYGEVVVESISKLKSTEFTIADVASLYDSYGNSDLTEQMAINKARNNVKKWKMTGLIKQIDAKVNGARKPVNQYKIIDPRIEYLIKGYRVNPTKNRKSDEYQKCE